MPRSRGRTRSAWSFLERRPDDDVPAVAQARADGVTLDVSWLEGYGGGLFVPFADATSGDETFGAGRYLLDTVKGADLGVEGDRLVLDFNFAYQPWCSYDGRWACPLAPPANRLEMRIKAGERLRGD